MCGPQNWNKIWNEHPKIHSLALFYRGQCSKEEYTSLGSTRTVRKPYTGSTLQNKNQKTDNFSKEYGKYHVSGIMLRTTRSWLAIRIQTGSAVWRVLHQFSCCNSTPHKGTTMGILYRGQDFYIWLSTEMKSLSKQKIGHLPPKKMSLIVFQQCSVH